MKTLLIGLDSFDPTICERLYEAGRLPHLGRYMAQNNYSRFAVTNPPQSEVSWTSIATGLNPGGHGMFDFVHRNPENYGLHVSLLPTKSSLVGTQFVPPSTATTLFDQAVEDGYAATSLWWPATFPAKLQSPVRTIPGLGTPDILGQLGVGTLLTVADGLPQGKGKSRYKQLQQIGTHTYSAELAGPLTKKGAATVSVRLRQVNENSAEINLSDQTLKLKVGEWSDIIHITFKVGLFSKVTAITRVMLGTDPLQVYFLPLQIDPLRAIWPYAATPSYAKNLWNNVEPYLTAGWPQDTSGFEDGCINDREFLKLCEDIVATRERILMYALDSFEEGVMGCVFDTLDRVSHMFLQQRPDIIDSWYVRLDAMIGRIEAKIASKSLTQLIILSDHGFSSFDQKVNLNSWLRENGYLATKNNVESGAIQDIDWSQTQAYAIGLNSVYFNLAGRERDGIVSAENLPSLQNELMTKLRAWQDSSGTSVITNIQTQADAFDGPLASYGPDLVVGPNTGFRVSAETGLGGFSANLLEPNTDRWRADHCIDATLVPGVIFAKNGLSNYPAPSYRDIPALAIGKQPKQNSSSPPPQPSSNSEDEAALQKRLESLGYL